MHTVSCQRTVVYISRMIDGNYTRDANLLQRFLTHQPRKTTCLGQSPFMTSTKAILKLILLDVTGAVL